MTNKNHRIIAIVGLMGVGKSTIGKKLATDLGYYFVDSDQEIEDFSQMSINQIFADKGEQYFRDIERKIIKQIIEREENIVLSLGGGAFENQEMREILLARCTTVWLKAQIDTILFRIGNKSNRPLLNNQNKREVLQDLIAKRYPNFEKSDLHIDTSDISHDEIVTQIIDKITK